MNERIDTILAHDPSRRTNAQAIADLAALGVIRASDRVLDATYGLGRFWTCWRPTALVRGDLNPAKAPDVVLDATALPFTDSSFDVVVFDPPYKLTGTDRLAMDDRCGLDRYRSPAEIRVLINAGTAEACRVARRVALIKCMDQIANNRQHWQTVDVHRCAEDCGWEVVDEIHVAAAIPQPRGRRQLHLHGRPSTLLVLGRQPRRRQP